MPRREIHRAAQRMLRSEQIEIFPVLPFGDIGPLRFFRCLLAASRNLSLLDMRVIVHERVAKAGSKACVGAQHDNRLFKRSRQRFSRTSIWGVSGRAGIEPAGNTI